MSDEDEGEDEEDEDDQLMDSNFSKESPESNLELGGSLKRNSEAINFATGI